MGAADKSLVDYQAIEMERLSELQKSITERLATAHGEEISTGQNLRRSVLGNVVAGNYDEARTFLDSYIDSKKDYPNFQKRAGRFRKHCLDLIHAVEAKRTFHGLGGLPLAKQQELYEKVADHFEELKHNLKSIERMDNEARLDDIRSTTWVVKALVNCTFFIVTLAFILDVKHGLASSFNIVFGALIHDLTAWVFKLFSW